MTDLANRSGFTLPGHPDAPLPGPVVRDLVAWTEQDISAMERELDAALREAEVQELRLSRHPAAHLVAPPGAPEPVPVWQAIGSSTSVVADQAVLPDQWAPVDGPSAFSPPPLPPTASLPDGPSHSEGNRLPPGVAPRTTVVRRDPPPTAPEMVGLEAADEPVDPTYSLPPVTRREILHGRRRSWADRFKGHWMMKAGMAIALLGLVLLKLG